MTLANRTTAARLAVSLEAAGWRPFAEWIVWLGLAAFAWIQSGFFARDLPHYRFGTAGWPQVICLMIVAGATAQLLLQLGRLEGAETVPAPRAGQRYRAMHRVFIFALPFVFLWLTPLIGFYVATPLFTLALLLLLDVRRPVALLGVTAIVWGLVLLIFTRLFYVALPEGLWDGFYEANIAIIDLVRVGM
jgi:hypothetical protein